MGQRVLDLRLAKAKHKPRLRPKQGQMKFGATSTSARPSLRLAGPGKSDSISHHNPLPYIKAKSKSKA